jgi:hypothetical protein
MAHADKVVKALPAPGARTYAGVTGLCRLPTTYPEFAPAAAPAGSNGGRGRLTALRTAHRAVQDWWSASAGAADVARRAGNLPPQAGAYDGLAWPLACYFPPRQRPLLTALGSKPNQPVEGPWQIRFPSVVSRGRRLWAGFSG